MTRPGSLAGSLLPERRSVSPGSCLRHITRSLSHFWSPSCRPNQTTGWQG